MIEPTENDIGRKVIYTGNTHPGGELEEGVITSFNSHCVFVRYGSDYGSKGASREDLEWLAAQPGGEEYVDPNCVCYGGKIGITGRCPVHDAPSPQMQRRDFASQGDAGDRKAQYSEASGQWHYGAGGRPASPDIAGDVARVKEWLDRLKAEVEYRRNNKNAWTNRINVDADDVADALRVIEQMEKARAPVDLLERRLATSEDCRTVLAKALSEAQARCEELTAALEKHTLTTATPAPL
jgi:hypothetical protein